MGGIAGIVNARLPEERLPALLDRMREPLVHRGPDETGTVVFAGQHAGLASQRLSIVDLAHGRQPFANEDETVFVAFNGKVYNHSDLRGRLKAGGHRFRSRCDTEVIVHLYEDLGLECLQHLHGMFALAVYDCRSRRLLLARDHAGMKPLYFAETSNGCLFASEVKALLASGLVRAEPDLKALDSYLALGWFPAPSTGFRGIEKLRAGSYILVDRGRVQHGKFWSPRYEVLDPSRDEDEYARELDTILENAVKSHLSADVPVGAYVSGGWDSSLVASKAARLAGYQVKTFSIVFPEDPRTDESQYSRCLARHLRTDHHEVEFRVSQVPHLLAKATRHMEEPCSAAPTLLAYQLAALASREVKVVLSGEGADELFGGYRWLRTQSHYAMRRILPRSPLRLLAERTAHPKWRRVLNILAAEDDVAADAEWFRSFSSVEKAQLLHADFRAGGPDMLPLRPASETLASCTNHLERRLSLDFTGRLPDAILLMGDKMSMAHSLEVRMPFLDREVVNFALRLPSHMKVRRGCSKYVLSLLVKDLPPEIAGRTKFGLGYPVQSLFLGSTGRFIRESLLDSDPVGGMLNRRYIESKLDTWLSPRYRNYRRALTLLFLQSWWTEFFGSGTQEGAREYS